MRPPLPLAALILVAAAGAGSAQEQPRYLPTRDVTITYQLTATQPGLPPSVTAHITAAGDIRVDSADRGALIYHVGAGWADWVLPQGKVYFEVTIGNSLAGTFLPNSGARFTREGQSVVAGRPCTRWGVAAPRGSGTACVTPDGVILQAQGGDARGASGEIRATDVTYAAQPAALFKPPQGAMRLSLPDRLPSRLRIPQ